MQTKRSPGSDVQSRPGWLCFDIFHSPHCVPASSLPHRVVQFLYSQKDIAAYNSQSCLPMHNAQYEVRLLPTSLLTNEGEKWVRTREQLYRQAQAAKAPMW